ncbi:MAG: ribulose-phosphate 3-epimerase [Clostridia bacterium]
MANILVAPSILSGDFANMEKSVKDLEKWGGDLVHCDVMDGVYVSNMTFGMPMVAAIKRITSLPLDVHLMITEPERYVEEFVVAGASYLTFHPDASRAPLEALRTIRRRGVKAGIVFNPNIPFKDYAYLVPECDMILIMSVYAGRGGQKFIEETLDKVREAKAYIDSLGLDIPIEIDGGVTEENAERIRLAGATILVAGSSVYKSPNPERTIKILKGNI